MMPNSLFMKTIMIGLASLALIVIGQSSCEKSKNTQANCLRGKVVASKCMGTVIQITEGNFDPSLVTAKWRDTLLIQSGQQPPEFSNVFKLINPCDHQDLTEGKEFYFTIKTHTEAEKCNYCLAYDIAPPSSKLSVAICSSGTVK